MARNGWDPWIVVEVLADGDGVENAMAVTANPEASKAIFILME